MTNLYQQCSRTHQFIVEVGPIVSYKVPFILSTGANVVLNINLFTLPFYYSDLHVFKTLQAKINQ